MLGLQLLAIAAPRDMILIIHVDNKSNQAEESSRFSLTTLIYIQNHMNTVWNLGKSVAL